MASINLSGIYNVYNSSSYYTYPYATNSKAETKSQKTKSHWMTPRSVEEKHETPAHTPQVDTVHVKEVIDLKVIQPAGYDYYASLCGFTASNKGK